LSVANVTPLSQQLLFYVIAIIIVVVVILVARRLENSPIGRAWTAIREDEVAAIAMGVPLVRMKLLAFATGASFAGAIGVLYGAKQTFVSPESFSLIQSISILAMVIVGGIGGIRGALFGACVVTVLNLQVLKNVSLQINAWKNIDAVLPSPLPMILLLLLAGVILFFTLRRFQQWSKKLEGWVWRALPLLLAALLVMVAFSVGDFKLRDWPNQLEVAKYERLIFGVLLIVMMIFRPAGLIPEPRRRMELLAAKEEESGLPLDDAAVPPAGADSENEQGG
jgi:branched-chain amino acid transport system permease protein